MCGLIIHINELGAIIVTTILKHTDKKRDRFDLLIGSQVIADNGYESDNRILFDSTIDKRRLYSLKKSDFDRPMAFMVIDDNSFEDLVIGIDQIQVGENITFDLALYAGVILTNKQWHPKKYFEFFQQEILADQSINFEFKNFDDEDWSDPYHTSFAFSIYFNSDRTISELISELELNLRSITRKVESSLGGFKWKEEYAIKEAVFTNEVVVPLLRRMHFINIKYNHGIKEFGRDVLFARVDEFGNTVNYGIQVKAGNISGKVNSVIDEILGQVRDAFEMPFYNTDSKSENYISGFIIITSGYFSDNAKSKIVHKLPKGLIGATYFFDKEKILELVQKYWK